MVLEDWVCWLGVDGVGFGYWLRMGLMDDNLDLTGGR